MKPKTRKHPSYDPLPADLPPSHSPSHRSSRRPPPDQTLPMLAVLAGLVISATVAGHAAIGIAAALSLTLFARALGHARDRRAVAAADDSTGGRR